MSKYLLNEPHERLIQLDDLQAPQVLFPEIFEIENLKIDKNLPILKFINITASGTTNKNRINISVIVPSGKKTIDIFLFINQSKCDMFYQIGEGSFIFKNVYLQPGENLVELFYRIGNKRSSSIYSVIKKLKSGNKNEKYKKHT